MGHNVNPLIQPLSLLDDDLQVLQHEAAFGIWKLFAELVEIFSDAAFHINQQHLVSTVAGQTIHEPLFYRIEPLVGPDWPRMRATNHKVVEIL